MAAKAGDRYRYTGSGQLGGLINPGETVEVLAVGADDPSFGGDLVVGTAPDPGGAAGSPGTVGRNVAVSETQLAVDFDTVGGANDG